MHFPSHFAWLSLVRVHGQGVRLGVEHPLVQGKLVSVREQEVKIFERLAEEEGLHLVLGPGVQRIPHVTDCRVASAIFAILLNTL